MPLVKRKTRVHYEREGWTIMRGLVPPAVCLQIRRAFEAEVKPHAGPLLRQLTSRPEPHDFSIDGWMQNPLMTPHRTGFPEFAKSEERVMRASPLVEVASELLGSAVAMLQSAYFESSRGTKTHLDFNPIDASRPMIGAWVALESIQEPAGRFFVFPGSHRLPDDGARRRYLAQASKNYRSTFVAFDGEADEDAAQALLGEVIALHRLESRAPPLRSGDVLFWHNRLLHGSHPPRVGGGTRHSLLFHFVERTLVDSAALPTR